MWFVSRQAYWADGRDVVEIAYGGRDYANPDMLVPRYEGEGEEYKTATEAVEAALIIRDSWEQDYGFREDRIPIAVGHTMGMTMPFEADPSQPVEELRAWAVNFDRAREEAEEASTEELEAAEEIFDGWYWQDGHRVYPDYNP